MTFLLASIGHAVVHPVPRNLINLKPETLFLCFFILFDECRRKEYPIADSRSNVLVENLSLFRRRE